MSGGFIGFDDPVSGFSTTDDLSAFGGGTSRLAGFDDDLSAFGGGTSNFSTFGASDNNDHANANYTDPYGGATYNYYGGTAEPTQPSPYSFEPQTSDTYSYSVPYAAEPGKDCAYHDSSSVSYYTQTSVAPEPPTHTFSSDASGSSSVFFPIFAGPLHSNAYVAPNSFWAKVQGSMSEVCLSTLSIFSFFHQIPVTQLKEYFKTKDDANQTPSSDNARSQRSQLRDQIFWAHHTPPSDFIEAVKNNDKSYFDRKGINDFSEIFKLLQNWSVDPHVRFLRFSTLTL